MTTRVLFVDGDRSLLNAVERRLGFEYDITCCSTGDDALRLIERSGPFAVVVTEMQLTPMDGIQFIRMARAKSHDSVFMIQTECTDQSTVVQAINEGQCFRFLRKPCHHDALRRAIDSALRQHRLVASEREMLHKSLSSTVDVLTELQARCQPALADRACRTVEWLNKLTASIGREERWDYQVAARLNWLGAITLSVADQQALIAGVPTDPAAVALERHVTEVSSRLIEKMPRFYKVSQIIAAQWHSDGTIDDELSDTVRVGGTLLRTAATWTSLCEEGVALDEAMQQLLSLLPGLSQTMVEALVGESTMCAC